jgi:hypothetical protein
LGYWVAAGGAGFPPPAQAVRSSETGAIVAALLRDLVLPERDRLSPVRPPLKVYLAEETLAACPVGIVGPCIVDQVFSRAKLEAVKGRWLNSLTSLLVSINSQSQRLEGIEHGELTVGPRADWVKAPPNTPPLSISMPAVVNSQALVYVQFRSADWLVLLSKRDGAWVVAVEVALGSG